MEHSRTPKPYLTNKEFLAELVKCQDKGVASNTLGEMFMKLAERYSTKHQFAGYTYRDEMVNNAILACVGALMKFDPNKSKNPFAFYTVVIHNAFIQILNKEKRQRDIRDVLLVEDNMNPSFGYLERESDRDEDYG